MKKGLKTPILLVAFNRPDTTKKVFEKIREARPKKFFVGIDGPRENRPDDAEKIKEVIKIVSQVDWPCKFKTLIRKKNMGCLKAVTGAINWFFENVEEGIIFDDDCVPNPDFFRFCGEMLEKYKNDDRVMHVSGYNFMKGWQRDRNSYYFSFYPHIWGWATWRRAWNKMDLKMGLYPEFKKKGYLNDFFPSKIERTYVKRILDHAYSGSDAWDSQWLFTLMANNGLSIVPNRNLIDSIGFGGDATRTNNLTLYLAMPVKKMEFPLKHPNLIVRDRKSDERYVNWLFRHGIKRHFLQKTGLYKLQK